MSGFNYALDSYALSCCEVTYFLLHPAYANRHMSMANDVNRSCCERFTHGLIGLLEMIPVIGAIAALFELIIVKAGGHTNGEGVSTPTPRPQPVVTRTSAPSSAPSTPTPKASTPKPSAPKPSASTPRTLAVETVSSPVSKPVPQLKPSRSLLNSPAPAVTGNFRAFYESYVPFFARDQNGKAEKADAKGQQQALGKALLCKPDRAKKGLEDLENKYNATYTALDQFKTQHPNLRSGMPAPSSNNAPPPPPSSGNGPPPPPPMKGPPPPPPKGGPKASAQPASTGAAVSNVKPQAATADELSAAQRLYVILGQLEEANRPNFVELKNYLLTGYPPEELDGITIKHDEIVLLAQKYRTIADEKIKEQGQQGSAIRTPTPASSPSPRSPAPETPKLTSRAEVFLKSLTEIKGILEEYEKYRKEGCALIEKCRQLIPKMPANAAPPPLILKEFEEHLAGLKKLGTEKIHPVDLKLGKLGPEKTKDWFELREGLEKERESMAQTVKALEAVNNETHFGNLLKRFENNPLLETLTKKIEEVSQGKWKEPPKSTKSGR